MADDPAERCRLPGGADLRLGVLAGYLIEVAEVASKNGQDTYPTFDLGQIGHYLRRGMGAVIVQLILYMPVLFLVALGLVVAGLTLSYRQPAVMDFPVPGANRDDSFFISASTGLAGGILALTLILSMAVVPLTLYVGLRQELSLSAASEFVPDFIRRVGKELVLAEIFVMITGLCVLIVGLAACCIGVLPAAAWVGFAQHHLMGQLYALYLERGGAVLSLPTADAA